MEKLTPIHVGLFGHVDHGKTELARVLSEKVSTAGLDKHPEAKRRQMSIDIGFTAFTLDSYLVTLVDVPGHADLIRTAVSGASIIDVAILVVSASQGPQVQTGEHLVLLESLGIEKIVVALTKTDLVDEAKVSAVEESIRGVLSSSPYKDAPIVAVSSITGSGILGLKSTLLSVLSAPKRDLTGKFKMVIDHAFPIKGTGTVVTGTVMRGKVRVGDTIEIAPLNVSSRVKSIQTFKESREMAQAGDRVGIALQGVDHRSIHRGCYVSLAGSLKPVSHILARAKTNRFFKNEINPGLLMHVTIGMSSIQAEVFPYSKMEGKLVALSAPKNEEFTSYIKLPKPTVAELGDRILVSLLSLPPTTLRIAASGVVLETPAVAPPLKLREEKVGAVTRMLPKGSVVVGGLAKSKIGAEGIVGERITTENGVEGTISSTFGTKGLVLADFDRMPEKDEKVLLRVYREFKIG
nr:selenocysteine-specific translation elongation factor [Candidatus Njordarchaeum guaymaensis]